jgi:hypothetical protein
MSSTVLFSPASSLFLARQSALTKSRAEAAAVTRCSHGTTPSASHEEEGEGLAMVGRRRALASTAAIAACGVSLSPPGFAGNGLAATQGPLAGRIPGLSEPDKNGKFMLVQF